VAVVGVAGAGEVEDAGAVVQVDVIRDEQVLSERAGLRVEAQERRRRLGACRGRCRQRGRDRQRGNGLFQYRPLQYAT
jgi:hypothetical protein